MKTISKIYDKYCDVCKTLEGFDEQIAEEGGFFFKKLTITECASTPDELRKFVAKHFVLGPQNRLFQADIKRYAQSDKQAENDKGCDQRTFL